MKKQYVQTTLNAYLNESKAITLKRKYGNRQPIIVGSNAPLRNQILSFVAEGRKVSKVKLKRFIAGLNETSKNPVAAANMWIKRNAKYFITESKNGITYFKLSTIGRRLVNRLTPSNVSESKKRNIRRRLNEMGPSVTTYEDFDDDDEEEEMRPGSYDFVDREKGYERPGIYDEMDENEDVEECDEGDDKEKIDEAAKERIKKIIENIKSKNKRKKLNEEDDKLEDKEEDELTFDDLDLDGGDEDKGKNKEEDVEDEDVEDEDVEDEDVEDEDVEDEEGEEKVEITEFIITVDNVEEAIQELTELEVEAEQVVDEEGEEIEDQIKVSADDWDALRGWLEDKGVDIEEMFGGEIEVEDEIEGEEDLEGEGEEFDLEPSGEELDDLDLDVDLEGEGEGEEEVEKEVDVEESVTGMEREERKQTPNLIKGKEVTITIK